MKNSLQVAGGVVGAVVGFIATLLILELVGFGNRADPIMSGILALLVSRRLARSRVSSSARRWRRGCAAKKTPSHFSVTA